MLANRIWKSGRGTCLFLLFVQTLLPVIAEEPCNTRTGRRGLRNGQGAFGNDDSAFAEYHRGPVPPGSRQVEKHGLLWPPYPRPACEKPTCMETYHHTHYWPYPYNEMDQNYVRQVFHQQTANGWVSNTTLYDYHFEPETHQLNSAGLTHLSWILRQAPAQYRVVYISQAENTEITQARFLAVTKQSATFSNTPATILLRDDHPYSRPAIEVDLLRRQEILSLPVPRLSYSVGAKTTGGGGAASSSGSSSGGGSVGGGSPR